MDIVTYVVRCFCGDIFKKWLAKKLSFVNLSTSILELKIQNKVGLLYKKRKNIETTPFEIT